MQTADNLRQYRIQLREALKNDFQRKALDNFAVAYRDGRDASFADIDRAALIERIGSVKDAAIARLDTLFDQFRQKAEGRGRNGPSGPIGRGGQ